MTANKTPVRRSAAAPNQADGDPAGSRAAILAAARAEFAVHGLTGARVNTIASRAGVNKQLIYYYFGNKDGLYRSALETVYAEIRTQERSLNLGQMQPVAAMESLIGFSFDYLSQHPDFIGLLNHENAAGARHVRDSDAIRDTNSPLIELIAGFGSAASEDQSGPGPPTATSATSGRTTAAAAISNPCSRSVVDTAQNPPSRV